MQSVRMDPAHRMQRAIDNENDDGPYVVVHRGTIVSGELLIKNGKLRDELAKPHSILCSEMEAAGALASFPCIVISAISDYSHSHMNDQWQQPWQQQRKRESLSSTCQ